VYENKQKDDIFTEEKGEIYTKLNDILYKSTRFLLKPAVFLSLLECSGTNPALQMEKLEAAVSDRRGRLEIDGIIVVALHNK